MGIYANDVQKLYIAYFNRPADPVGLAYWEEQITKNGGSTAAVANAFSASAEYKALYDGKASAAIVDAIYQNLFGRAAEADGLVYWGVRLENGTFNIGSIAMAILTGAQNDDKKVIDNKTVIATEFTKALDTSAEILAYSGTAAATAARTFLATVGATDASLTAAKAAVATTVSTIASTVVANGKTFALTAGTDAVVGTDANDTIVGDVAFNATTAAYDTPTLGSFDTIDGGAGTDTLTISQLKPATGYTLPAATIKNVEKLVIKNDSGAVVADVSSATGMTDVSVTLGTAADVDVTTKSNVKSVTVTKATTSPSITDSGSAATTADTLASVTLVANAAAASISSDALTSLSLQDQAVGATITAAAGTRDLKVTLNNVTGGTVADAEATSVTVTGTGVKSTGVTLNAAKATTVTIQADKAVTLADVNIAAAKNIFVGGEAAATISATSTVTALEKIDSTNSTGGVTVTPALGTAVAFAGGAGKDAITVGATTKAITMGAGDDTVTVSVALGTGGSIDAGEGTDTLSLTAADAVLRSGDATFEATISNFEKVKIGAASAAGQTINLANLDDISYVVSAGGTAAAAAVQEVQTLTFTGTTRTDGNITVGGVTVAVLAADSAAVTAGKVAAALNGQTLTAPASTGNVTAAAVGDVVTVTFPNTAGNVTPVVVANGTSTITGTVAVAETTPGSLIVAAANFAITNMASGGTLELTGVQGASSVAVKDAATGAADVLNIKLNGTANLVNTAALTVGSVETINITATDSSVDTTTLTNPAAASTIMLAAADATKITVSGNHGVDFTGSTLTKVVELDASGVAATGATSTATAAQIATAGAVTFSSVIDNKAVTVKTGNGADVINVSSINGVSADSQTFLATNVTASTITTGEGGDQVTGSAGKDVIDLGAGNDTVTAGAEADTVTLGAGNDTVVFAAATDSTLAKMDVITDFVANTYGQGTSGAVDANGATTDATKLNGDVLNFDAITTMTKIAVGVFTSAADATVFLQNNGTATADTLGAALDSVTSQLYIDLNSDGTADMVIKLTGVTTLTTAAFADLT